MRKKPLFMPKRPRQSPFFVLTGLIFFFLLNVNARAEDYALSSSKLQAFLSLAERDIDLCAQILEISVLAAKDLTGEEVDLRAVERSLAQIAREARRRMRGQKEAGKRIEILNDYLFGEVFSVERSRLFEGSVEALLIPSLLKSREGHCLSLSLVYLCLAQRLKWPVAGVIVPNHFFVRYDDGQTRRNIETTDRGAPAGDDYYFSQFMKGYRDEVSLRDLEKKDILAIYLSNIANHYKLQWKLDKAIEILQVSAQMMPRCASVYTNLGNAFERSGKILSAIFEYQKALSLNPSLCETHYNIGLLHFLYTKSYDDAYRHGVIARQLGCRLHPEFRDFLESRSP